MCRDTSLKFQIVGTRPVPRVRTGQALLSLLSLSVWFGAP